MEKVIIRNVEISDISKLTTLCEELGYPANEDQVINRLNRILKSTSDIVYVAVENDMLVGWIHAFRSLRLETDSFAEIGGLVVSSEYRNKGIGKKLAEAAEKWAQKNGFSQIRVRSRVERNEAKRFYEREGYVVKKSQNVFEKKLD